MKGRITINLWRFIFLVMFFMLMAIPSFAQVYQYRDQNGRLCFTNQLSDVPEDQLPEVLMKQAKKSMEAQKTGEKAMDRNPSEPEKTTELPTETPGTETPGKPASTPIVEDLNKEKAALDKIYAELMKRKKDLKKEKETLKTPEEVKKYRKKVTRLNKEIDDYKKRNTAFQKNADDYNKAVREKGDE